MLLAAVPVLLIADIWTSGGSSNAFCSQMPFKVRSKNNPYPARIAHFPFPKGSYASPNRGPKFLFELGLTKEPNGEQLAVEEMVCAAVQAAPVGKIKPLA